MKMARVIRSATLLAVAVIAVACQDKAVAPTAPSETAATWTPRARANIVPGTCVSLATLYAEADVVFGGGGPNANSVKSKIDQIDKANKKGDTKKATEAAFNTVRFIFQKFKGPQPLAGTPEQVAALITHVFCFAGLDIVVEDPFNANLIDPSTQTQVVKSADNTAGTQLPPNSITEPTVLEFKKLPNAQTITRLDQYPGFFAVTASSASNTGPAAPVVVAICPDAGIPANIRARLRLGHQKTSGFEITPPADASFLTCPTGTASLTGFRGFVAKALSLVMPRTLHAASEVLFTGGVGGTASEFSPFAPVDIELSFSGGVGGTAGEFKKSGPTRSGIDPVGPTRFGGNRASLALSPGSVANLAAPCAAAEAVWSTELAQECRPGIVIRTALGTVMRDVPVSWAVTGGGGTVAVETPGTLACGTFGATASGTTSDTGRAGICWTMGPTPGTNTVSATPSAGGDAPPGVTFNPSSANFTALAIKATPVVELSCPTSVPFNGSAQTPCTASAKDTTHGLPAGIALGAVPVVYGPTSPPLAAGTYTADATFTATSLYNSATAHATFAIDPVVIWSASGPSGFTLLNNGTNGLPSMSYSYSLPGGGVPTQTWTFSTTAPSAGTIKQSYSYYGLHAWFQVTAFVRPFVIHAAVKTYLPGVELGPQNCCTTPSNGFTITGSATFTVSAGDTYGFEIGGSNFDSNSFLNGTFVTTAVPLYVNHVYDATGPNFGARNCWHDVTLTVVNATTLRWTNGCASPVSWLMHATANPAFYTSGPDYPYFGSPADVGFTLTFGAGGVIQSTTGPSGEVYTRVP